MKPFKAQQLNSLRQSGLMLINFIKDDGLGIGK